MTTHRVRRLTCCCCGAATRGRQWHNRDTGFGLCADCADWIQTRPLRNTDRPTDEEMQQTYGIRGVHYDIRDDPDYDPTPDDRPTGESASERQGRISETQSYNQSLKR